MMMDGAEYTIIGVYAKAKGGFFGENGQDNAIVDSAAHRREPLPAGGPLHDHGQGQDRQAARTRTTKCEGMHAPHTPPVPLARKNDFAISTPDQIIQQFDRITGLIGLVAIAISGAWPAGGRHRR